MPDFTLDQAYDLAKIRYRAGDPNNAARICTQILIHSPKHTPALALMGILEGEQGYHKKALRYFKAALAERPRSAPLQVNVAEAYRRLGQTRQAIRSLEAALALDPTHVAAHNGLGVAHRKLGDLPASLAAFRAAHHYSPQQPDILKNLGSAFLESSELNEAIDCFQELQKTGQIEAPTYSQWGTALAGIGDYENAIPKFEEALRLNPSCVRSRNNLASLLVKQHRLAEALTHFRTSLQLAPKDPSVHNNFGNALMKSGLVNEALQHFRHAIRENSESEAAWSNLLYYLPYSYLETPESIAEAFTEWRSQLIEPLSIPARSFTNDRSPERQLRIGYVSPNFRTHVVGQFILPFLKNHDRRRVVVFCYSQVSQEDEVTRACREAADHWRTIREMTDDKVCKTILEDRIDILVDLAMHSSGNRLGVFARKPAPIQATYLANIYTTGLTTVDYRISDPHLHPGTWNDPAYTEETVCLPQIYGCYTPTAAPPISPPPCLENGHITFGCLNNYCKVNDLVLDVWSQIISDVPDSRLILLVPDGAARSGVVEFMELRGITPDRLILTPGVSAGEYLGTYNQIDIALDPFPYQGITTTCDALWMSCPVVSYAGVRGIERAALSLLSNVGCPELVGRDLDDYVRIAVELARDPGRLVEFRETLRERMLASPLMDGPALANGLEDLFQDMWTRWLANSTSV